MLSPNFYTLIGALESAYQFIDRYYRDPAQANSGRAEHAASPTSPAASSGPEGGIRRSDEFLDPLRTASGSPVTSADMAALQTNNIALAHVKLMTIKQDLLNAEHALSLSLYQARQLSSNPAGSSPQDTAFAAAWDAFSKVMRTQSFVLAATVRRLMQAGTGATTVGAPEWEMMDRRLRRILKAFAEAGLGGGEGGAASNLPGIVGSSNQSISV
jgi:hypothetical protein